MAKRRRRVLPARKREDSRDSLLIQSAESLGRVIGSLQRQFQGSSKRVSVMANDVIDAIPTPPRVTNPFGTSKSRKSGATPKKRTARKAAAGARTTASRKRAGSRRLTKKR
jgi:hypothetical protein